MNYRIDYLPSFEKEGRHLSKKYKSLKEDLDKLEKQLLANPTAGVYYGGDIYKVRMSIASKNRGKSHGARVITWVFKVSKSKGEILMLHIYDKQVKDNISETELRLLKAEARQ